MVSGEEGEDIKKGRDGVELPSKDRKKFLVSKKCKVPKTGKRVTGPKMEEKNHKIVPKLISDSKEKIFVK